MIPLLGAGLLLTVLWWAIFRWGVGPAWQVVFRRALGQLLELLLYGDSPPVLGRVFWDLLATNLRLGRMLLGPSLACGLCLLAVVVGLRGYCEWRPVQVGESFLVSAVSPSDTRLEHGPGLREDGSPLRSRDTNYWRLVASQAGAASVWLSESDARAQVLVGSEWAYLRPRQGQLQVHYARRELWLGDRLINWPIGLGLACLAWLALAAMGKGLGMSLVRSGKAGRPLLPEKH